MDVSLTYRGRVVTDADVAFIGQLIAAHPTASRRALSKELCVAWNWVQPNGALRDMVCRGLMLALHRAGHIHLPAQRHIPPNSLAKRGRPAAVSIDDTPLQGSLDVAGPLEFRQVRRTSDEPLFNSLMEQHHYLGYTQPVGEHLKYLVYAGGRPLAGLAWSSAPRHLECRDRFIGWSAQARRQNIRFLAYNLRFLILPWVKIPHLASHILGRMARVLPGDWEGVYGHPVYFLETFVDPQRFKGTCYRAANWTMSGPDHWPGQGRPDPAAQPPGQRVLGYPLCRDFPRTAFACRMKTMPIQRMDLHMNELEDILQRRHVSPLTEQDSHMIKAVVESYLHLTELLEDKRTTIDRLRQAAVWRR